MPLHSAQTLRRVYIENLSHVLLRRAQSGDLPLHTAAEHQASEVVVAALLAAHLGAAKETDRVSPLP